MFARENTKELAQLSKGFLFPTHSLLGPFCQSKGTHLTAQPQSRTLGECKFNQIDSALI